MPQIIKIISIESVTHDVISIKTEKPAGLQFKPGQAVDVSLNKPGWEEELRPFTFTSLPEEKNLEFTIKTYPSHKGVTNQLRMAAAGDELIIQQPFGAILYKGEGIFIAGGAGITPFIAIFKDLKLKNEVGNNKLIFANKTKNDIILEDMFTLLLGSNFINVLSEEKIEGYEQGFISADLIKKNITENTKYYYLCGPPPMMKAMKKHLVVIGIDSKFIIEESF